MACHGRVFPVTPEPGQTRVDEALVCAAEHIGAEPEPLESSGAEGVDEDVCIEEELLYECEPGGGLEVDGEGAFGVGEEVGG